MNTRQKDTTAKVVGGVIGAVPGTALAIGIQIMLEIPFPYFYLAGLVAGAGAGAALGSWLVLRRGGHIRLAPGVYVKAPGWTKAGAADVIKLSKGENRLIISIVHGKPNDTAAEILEKYAKDGSLDLTSDPTPVMPTGEAVGIKAGERRSFTAADDGEMFEGEITAFSLQGEGLVFHSSAPTGLYSAVADDAHGVVISLERIAPTFG